MCTEPTIALGAIFDLRMDLVIAAIQFAAVIDTRHDAVECRVERGGHAVRSRRVGGAVAQPGVGGGAGDGHADGDVRIVVFVATERKDTDAIAVGRQPFGALRTGTAWFAVVFDIDAEGDAVRSASAVAAVIGGVSAHAGEADLVGRGFARFRTAITITLIAEGVVFARAGRARTRVRVAEASQAGALQAVEAAGVEVAIQAGPEMANVFPFTLDARRGRIPFGSGAD